MIAIEFRTRATWTLIAIAVIGCLVGSISARAQSNTLTYLQAVGPPPAATSSQFADWVQALVEYRRNEIPVNRGTTYYFSTSGDDANSGLTRTAPKCTIGEAQRLIDEAPEVANVRLSFARGDTWYTDVGLKIKKKGVTIDSYGRHPDRPQFNRFTKLYAGGWQRTAVRGVFRRAEEDVIGWVYSEQDGWEKPFYRASSLSGIETTPSECAGSFYYEDGWLYIRYPTGAINQVTIRGLPANDTNGCELAAHDNRLQDMVFLGFGLDPNETSNQAAGVKVNLSGDAAAIVERCESFYCSSHAMHVNAGSLNRNDGIVTFIDCAAGFCQANGTPGETIFNSYVYGGKQETLFIDCEARHGTLPSGDWYIEGTREVRGRSCFCHTAGTARFRLMIALRMSAPDLPFGCGRPVRFADAPNAFQLGDARSFVVDEEFRQSRPGCSIEINTPEGAKIGGVYRGTMSHETMRAWTSYQQNRGWVANCHFFVDMRKITPGFIAMYNGSGNHLVQVEHCDFIMQVAADHKVRIPDHDANFSVATSWRNCIFGVVGTPLEVNVGRGNPVLINNGYFNTAGSFGNDQLPVPIFDAAELDEWFIPVGGSASFATGSPTQWPVEVDRMRQPRFTPPSLGDLEHVGG